MLNVHMTEREEVKQQSGKTDPSNQNIVMREFLSKLNVLFTVGLLILFSKSKFKCHKIVLKIGCLTKFRKIILKSTFQNSFQC